MTTLPARLDAVARVRRRPVAALACLVSAVVASPAAAQWQSALGIGSAVSSNAFGQLRGSPLHIAAGLGYEGERVSFDVQGTWAGGGVDASRAGESVAHATAHLFSPSLRGWSLVVAPAAATTRLRPLEESGRLSLLGGARWQRGSFEMRALSGRSRPIMGPLREGSTDFSVEMRGRMGRAQLVLASRGTQWTETEMTETDTVYLVAGYPFTGQTTRALSRSRNYVDTEATAVWPLRFVQVEGRAGIRGLGERSLARQWAGVRLLAPLADRLAIVAEARRDPGSPQQGLRARRLASLGVQVATASLRRRVDTRAAERAERLARVEVAVSPDSGGTRTLVLRGLEGRRVEITGDLTSWMPVALEARGPRTWSARLRIEPGAHHMLVRVDGGDWWVPPVLPTARHELGAVGVLLVKP